MSRHIENQKKKVLEALESEKNKITKYGNNPNIS